MTKDIADTYTRHKSSFSPYDDPSNHINSNLTMALDFCLKNNLITYLHIKRNDEIAISIDVMARIDIPGVTSFKDLASILAGFEYKSARINGQKTQKVVAGSRPHLVKFLDPVYE
jgi:hypothetical protein